MKIRWFVVILTIGLLLCVMPLSALALSSDPITDSDGTIIGWEDLSTDLCSFDVYFRNLLADVLHSAILESFGVPIPLHTGNTRVCKHQFYGSDIK